MLKTEAAKSRKQRRTLKQFHEELRELGFEGSYDRVAAFARVWRAGQTDRGHSAGKRTVEALIGANRKKPNLKNRVEEATESAVVAFYLEQAAFGQVRASNGLRTRGIFASPSAVRSVWLRRDLELERHVAETGAVLTEAQVVALERKQDDDVAHGEIETVHPGYLASQDTFYVDTYSK